jgi:hypothetical protein
MDHPEYPCPPESTEPAIATSITAVAVNLAVMQKRRINVQRGGYDH